MDEDTYQKLQSEVRMQALENVVCNLAKVLFTTIDQLARTPPLALAITHRFQLR